MSASPFEGQEPIRFTHDLTVEEEHLDALRHVNNVVYVRWVQDMAGRHWRHAAPSEVQETTLWVVLRHEIDYRRPAWLGDRLRLITWVGETDGVTFERFTEVRKLDAAGEPGRPLVQARSVWCVLDPETLRPKRIGQQAHAPFYQFVEE